MARAVFTPLILLVCILLIEVSLPRLHQLEAEQLSAVRASDKPLYLPNGKALGVISFGYRNVLADLLWFNTVSYFGKHFRSDKNYEWLFHMCNIVTDLDPRAAHVYRFGATMLAWEVNEIALSNKLLDKATGVFPDSWLYYYLRGFNHMFFSKDYEKARQDFVTASKLPGAHPITASLAAKTIAELSAPETAIRFLEEMIVNTKDPIARKALEERLEKFLELQRKHQGNNSQ